MEALCSDAELQQYHPTKQLPGVAQRLVSLENSNLQLAALSMNDANFQSVENLVERIVWHYTMQAHAPLSRHPREVPSLVSPPVALRGPHRQRVDALLARRVPHCSLNAVLFTTLPSPGHTLPALIGSLAHLSAQALKDLYRLIGSSDLIGNPAGLFNDVWGGVQCVYYEPRNGLVKSPGVPSALPVTA